MGCWGLLEYHENEKMDWISNPHSLRLARTRKYHPPLWTVLQSCLAKPAKHRKIRGPRGKRRASSSSACWRSLLLELKEGLVGYFCVCSLQMEVSDRNKTQNIWLGVWLPSILHFPIHIGLLIIIPIDEVHHIFQVGVFPLAHQPPRWNDNPIDSVDGFRQWTNGWTIFVGQKIGWTQRSEEKNVWLSRYYIDWYSIFGNSLPVRCVCQGSDCRRTVFCDGFLPPSSHPRTCQQQWGLVLKDCWSRWVAGFGYCSGPTRNGIYWYDGGTMLI